MFKRVGQLASCGLLLMFVGITPALAFKDPTQPAQYRAAVKRSNLTLESILFSATRRVAVINGKALQEGDKFDGARVLSISKDKVRITRYGKTFFLRLQRPTIRQEH